MEHGEERRRKQMLTRLRAREWTARAEKDMVEPHGEESRIEWLISCVRWKETAAHPMSWLAVTFTTQEINSLIPPGLEAGSPCGS